MNKKMTFEQANAKLEEIVKNMENKGLTLQESVEQYAQACELLAYCMKELETGKGQIEDINERIQRIKNGEGNLVED
ncbi:exodeoxyribonuclease VII small subunit [Ruminococcus sp.]|uniref:exodeoxyribonuclease VII small subunit n=1 Tax=Ruminococcus sp. TaxID=41978 RepID=UPI0026129072|nr:exodeoxyribonuclease VII small subunit [Ruminococcus sp.]MDD6989165.1 exodeoxyribonuclease VII small subunit [Ruminococcus sp.]MDY6202420.1 exodeoxyribonuclease VII small subunit [Ruminococcus sp.]